MKRSVTVLLIAFMFFSSLGLFQKAEGICISMEEPSASIPVVNEDIQEIDTMKYQYDHLLPTRDISIPEIEADRIWAMLDSSGLNITGEGITIADLDTGVDWSHPDLWFADGMSYNWLDGNSNEYFDSEDAVDLNHDDEIQMGESIGIIDTQGNSVYNTEMDWIWVESVANDGVPQLDERFFVANDTNDNGVLDLGERLVMLNTPKTKYIVEDDGNDQTGYITWQRGVNLTESTHTQTNTVMGLQFQVSSVEDIQSIASTQGSHPMLS